MKINILDNNLINQIAAGEVIERPSSVCKELIENSIDAKSTEIIIYIKQLGLDEIKVIDNGIGIDKEDLENSCKRHATSKIKNIDDLYKLKSLGFRGEALPSISSISDLSIISRTKDSEIAYMLSLKGNEIESMKPVNGKVGTEIIVRNLFYNTPIRYKYLKSEQSEKKSIIDTVKRLAIGNLNIKFKLYIDDNLVLNTYALDNFSDIISSIYDVSYTKDMIEINKEISKIKFRGVFLSPKFSRTHKNDIYIYINKRYVQNYLLKEAIINGYKTSLMLNRYPISILYITIDPSLVDSNIHPQKLTVKISNEYALKSLITDLITEQMKINYQQISTYNKVEKMDNDLINSYNKQENTSYVLSDIDSLDLFNNIKKEENYIKEQFFDSSNVLSNDEINNKIPYLEYIGSLHKTYLLFQNDEGLYLIDQHAAAERINFEILEKKELDLTKITNLLIPYQLNIDKSYLILIRDNILKFKKYHIYFNDQLEIIKLPIVLLNYDINSLILYMLDKMKNNEEININSHIIYEIKTKACKKSIKANHLIRKEEVEKLILDLRSCNNPYHCPHGRPVIAKISLNDILKLFKRIL